MTAPSPTDKIVDLNARAGVARGEVNHEQISRFFVTELNHDVRTPQKEGLAGLDEQFLKDFFRVGISVNGQRFGGQGTQLPEIAKLEVVQEFIDAAGEIISTYIVSETFDTPIAVGESFSETAECDTNSKIKGVYVTEYEP